MIGHYLKTAFRNILKYKMQTVICIAMMAVSVALISAVASFLGTMRKPAVYSMPYADRIVRVRPDYNKNKAVELPGEFAERILSQGLPSAERIYYHEVAQAVSQFRVTRADGSRRFVEGHYVTAKSDHLRFFGVCSAITGEIVEPLRADEIIVTKSFALRLLGDVNVVGKTIDIADYSVAMQRDETGGYIMQETYVPYKIRDVMEDPSSVDDINGSQGNAYFSDESNAPKIKNRNLIVLLRKGKTVADLKGEADKIGEEFGESVMVEKLDYDKSVSVTWTGILKPTVWAVCLIILLTAFLGYMRMQVQMLWMRTHEIALRVTLGSRNSQLSMQFAVEVAIILAIALILTLCLDQLLRTFIQENFGNLLRLVNWAMDDFKLISVEIFAVAAAVCAAIIAVTIWQIRCRQTGLALQMRPGSTNRFRTVALGVQMVMTTAFISFSVMMFGRVEELKQQINLPKDKARLERTIQVPALLAYVRTPWEEFKKKATAMEGVEKVTAYEYVYKHLKIKDENEEEGKGILVYKQIGNDYTDLFGIEVRPTGRKARPEESIAVNENLKKYLQEMGLWERGWIEYGDERRIITGTFAGMPYENRESSLFYGIAGIERMTCPVEVYVTAKKGEYKEVKRRLEEMFHEIEPETDATMHSIHETRSPGFAPVVAMFRLFVILTIVSIISSVAGLYSSISLETRHRRKEMALRKINGAAPRDIALLFARRYIILLAVCFAIAFSICVILYDAFLRDIFETDGNKWDTFIVVCVAITVITVATVASGIHRIMNINPAECIKE